MAIYQSMQRVRFSSPDGYEKFKVVFTDVRKPEDAAGIPAPHLVDSPGRPELAQRSQLLD